MFPMVTVYTQSPWHNFSFLRVSSRNSCKRSAASELSLNCLHMSPEQVSCLTKKRGGGSQLQLLDKVTQYFR